MAKISKASEESVMGAPSATAMVVRNSTTGRFVTVKGVGALKGDALKIEKGVSLLKPIAKQALVRRARRRESE